MQCCVPRAHSNLGRTSNAMLQWICSVALFSTGIAQRYGPVHRCPLTCVTRAQMAALHARTALSPLKSANIWACFRQFLHCNEDAGAMNVSASAPRGFKHDAGINMAAPTSSFSGCLNA